MSCIPTLKRLLAPSLLLAGLLFSTASPLFAVRPETRPVWVFFQERDHSQHAVRAAEARVTARARARRERCLGSDGLQGDLDPLPGVLRAVRATGAHVRTVSRWLNAVSVDATPAQEVRLAGLRGVREVRPVVRDHGLRPVADPVEKAGSGMRGTAVIDSSAYGVAWKQDSLIHAPQAHQLGFTGEGVRVGFLDAGFIGVFDHDAFQHLIIAGTFNTHDSSDQVETHNHGTRCLSVAAANDTDSFIGTAPNIEVLLVVTEDASSEYPAEEDYWVEGLEWAEANGADLISSSLSYTNWYSFEDLDGHSGVTSIAANAAASRGLLVVCSAGNNGRTLHPWCGAPAAADSALAIGASNIAGEFATFTSHGPTVDGRIKPDVAAVGEDGYTANEAVHNGYVTGSGTSYSCPAVAGVAALLLQADPTLEPMEIVSILRSTASQAETPDNELGWGVVNAEAALNLLLNVKGEQTLSPLPEAFLLEGVFPNPTNAAALLRLDLRRGGQLRVSLYNLLGERVAGKIYALPAGEARIALPLDQLPSGSYIARVSGANHSESTRVTLVK